LLRRIFAPDQNLGGCEKLLRRIFALHEKFRRTEQVKENENKNKIRNDNIIQRGKKGK
jgi:hypothetical protein